MMVHTETGALLHNDHVATIQALQSLEGFLVRQSSKRPADTTEAGVRKTLQGLIDMVANEVGRHFGFEEQHLFPLLAERGEAGIGDFLMHVVHFHVLLQPLTNGGAKVGLDVLADDQHEPAETRPQRIVSRILDD